jgi:hypothetical protein
MNNFTMGVVARDKFETTYRRQIPDATHILHKKKIMHGLAYHVSAATGRTTSQAPPLALGHAEPFPVKSKKAEQRQLLCCRSH